MNLPRTVTLFALVGLAGCRSRYDTTSLATLQPERVPGTYHCDAIWGSGTLVLRPDHTFHESISTIAPGTGLIPAGPFYGYPQAPVHPEVDGTWSLQPLSTSPSKMGIEFIPFTRIEDFGSDYIPDATTDIEQGRSGVIRIQQQPDSFLYFALNAHNPPPPTQSFEQGVPLHR